MAGKKTAKQVKLKKLNIAKKWTFAKTQGKKNLASWIRSSAKEKLKECKGAELKNELAELKEIAKIYAALDKSFKSGFTKKLRLLEKETDPKKLIDGATDALTIVKDYGAKLDRSGLDKKDPELQKVSIALLYGALGTLKRELKATIKDLRKVLKRQIIS